MVVYLYHKRHRKTGLNYFGKTTRDPYRYDGSGKYWKDHLRVHSRDIDTIQVWEFDNTDECSDFALSFSEKHQIVESKDWANLKPENGVDGGNNPYAHTEKARQKRKQTLTKKLAAGILPPNNNTPERIAKANMSRAIIFAKKKELGIKARGPDKKKRKAYVKHKPFVNRNTPESLAKRRETLARKKLLILSS